MGSAHTTTMRSWLCAYNYNAELAPRIQLQCGVGSSHTTTMRSWLCADKHCAESTPRRQTLCGVDSAQTNTVQSPIFWTLNLNISSKTNLSANHFSLFIRIGSMGGKMQRKISWHCHFKRDTLLSPPTVVSDWALDCQTVSLSLYI